MNNEEIDIKGFIFFIGMILIIILMCNTIVFVKTGEIGIVTKFGAVQGRVMNAGINFKIPFVNGVKKMNCKIQKLEIDTNSASKDLQDVNTKVVINYNVNVENACNLYKEVGKDYESIILEPTIIDTVKGVTAEYTAEELITKRTEVTQKILIKANERLENQGITVSNVNVTNFNFSEAFNKAIEEKQVAEQNVKKAEQELEKAKIEGEQKIVKAKAEAESLRIQKQELSEELLQLKAIEKWNGQLPTTTTSDAIPFLNVK